MALIASQVARSMIFLSSGEEECINDDVVGLVEADEEDFEMVEVESADGSADLAEEEEGRAPRKEPPSRFLGMEAVATGARSSSGATGETSIATSSVATSTRSSTAARLTQAPQPSQPVLRVQPPSQASHSAPSQFGELAPPAPEQLARATLNAAPAQAPEQLAPATLYAPPARAPEEVAPPAQQVLPVTTE